VLRALQPVTRQGCGGGIRELKNTGVRVLIMSEEDEGGAQDLSEVLRQESAGPPGEAPGSLKGFKESAERAFLVEKLREHQWNISATATAIGTPRSNLYKKLEQYGISAERDG
jgi:two-component system nitrogen regulation response regulator NtrX